VYLVADRIFWKYWKANEDFVLQDEQIKQCNVPQAARIAHF